MRPRVLRGNVSLQPAFRCVGLATVDALKDVRSVVLLHVLIPFAPFHPLLARRALVKREVLGVVMDAVGQVCEPAVAHGALVLTFRRGGFLAASRE